MLTIILLITAVGFIYGWRHPQKREKKRPQARTQIVTVYDCKRAEQERKEAAKKKQAAEDIEHLQENLKLLYPLLDAAKAKYEDATDEKEIEKLTKRIITLQNQIHAAESKIERANNIIKYGA